MSGKSFDSILQKITTGEKKVFSYDLPIDDDQYRGSLNAILRQKNKKSKQKSN